MCGLDSRISKTKYERFRQPCGLQPTACWEALESGKLKVGEREYPVVMNATRSHMEGLEDCSGSCRPKAGILNRKITQVFMEVLIEKEWIWWARWPPRWGGRSWSTGIARQSWRMGCGYGQHCQELGERTFLQIGEARQPSTKSRSTVGRTQVRFGYSCSAAGECAAEAFFCCTTENSHHLEA
jgi:hypothetical protein